VVWNIIITESQAASKVTEVPHKNVAGVSVRVQVADFIMNTIICPATQSAKVTMSPQASASTSCTVTVREAAVVVPHAAIVSVQPATIFQVIVQTQVIVVVSVTASQSTVFQLQVILVEIVSLPSTVIEAHIFNAGT
jgi:hypothetical protein